MNPNSGEFLQLPVPMPEAQPDGSPAEVAPGKPELVPSRPESGSQAGSAAPPTIPLPTAPSVPVPLAQITSTSAQGNPAQASDDADLIEKEWVTKAKQIVASTRNDPYKQSEELNIFKADYMKKRYNRTIKVSK